jgi:hypothetical protein
MMQGVTAAQCTQECVKSGSDYALVVGDKVYTLKGDKAAFDKFAGANLVVKGKTNGVRGTVESIKSASADATSGSGGLGVPHVFELSGARVGSFRGCGSDGDDPADARRSRVLPDAGWERGGYAADRSSSVNLWDRYVVADTWAAYAPDLGG